MNRRYSELDVFRGVAIMMMVVFHLLYDLNYFHLMKVGLFSDPFWIVYRAALVFLFFGVSGACLVLMHGDGVRWGAFWARFLKIAGAALLVTVSTYLFKPKFAIWFGVLHLLAVSSLLAIPFLTRPRLGMALAVLLLAFGYMADLNEGRHYLPYLSWIGFGSDKLRTYDLFPIIPYFGYVLLGSSLAVKALGEGKSYLFASLNQAAPWNRFLSALGSRSLVIYLVHRPLSFGGAYLISLRPWEYL